MDIFCEYNTDLRITRTHNCDLSVYTQGRSVSIPIICRNPIINKIKIKHCFVSIKPITILIKILIILLIRCVINVLRNKNWNGNEPWTSCVLIKHTNHYSALMCIPRKLKTSLWQYLVATQPRWFSMFIVNCRRDKLFVFNLCLRFTVIV